MNTTCAVLWVEPPRAEPGAESGRIRLLMAETIPPLTALTLTVILLDGDLDMIGGAGTEGCESTWPAQPKPAAQHAYALRHP